MKRFLIASILTVGGIGGAALGSGLLRAPELGWREITWPFPRDAWPAGRAFRCGAASCGGNIEVYVRPKLGFCSNCATGVTDDAEVDGVSDVDMISQDFVPSATGEQTAMAGMAGRTRSYVVQMPDGTSHPAAGIAISRHCDLFVVASQGASAGSPAAQHAIAALLESPPMLAWIQSFTGKS